MHPRIKFGRVEVDGTYVILHVTVSAMGLEYETGVRFTEERAHQLVREFHEALARLGRGRLAP